MDRDPRIRLFIDIGTNCEIVLGGRDWLPGDGRPGRARVRGRRDPLGMRAADGADRSGDDHPDRDLKLHGNRPNTEPPACAAPALSTR